MSSVYTGSVTSLDSKIINSKTTGKAFRVHYVTLDEGIKINVGFKQLFEVGQKVSLTAEEKYGEYKMVTAGSSGTGSASSASTSAPPKKEYASGKNTKFPVPRDHGDYSIIRQNALTNAVNLYSKGGKPTSDYSDEIVEAIIRVAYKFAEFSSGHREERILKEMGAGKPSA